ncbi:MAG: hypothetical protein JW940_00215 [Polyangiaceae bacterium]|nr:hypothetical protein [Polyangiaceae bacterium]
MAMPPTATCEIHQQAVRVFHAACQTWPAAMGSWLVSTDSPLGQSISVIGAEAWPHVVGPRMYAVPDPEPERTSQQRAGSPEAELVAELLSLGSTASSVERVHVDFAELARQTMLEGGAPIQLFLELEARTGAPAQGLLGILLPEPGSDGRNTTAAVLQNCSWQLTVLMAKATQAGASHIPLALVRPVYLWHGDGLKDPEETCSVIRADTGNTFLDALLCAGHGSSDHRKSNTERLRDLTRKHEARVAAARRREQTMGDPMISEAELSALMPDIDLDRDFVSMRQGYDSLRLWEHPLDDLLQTLPVGCTALALFGHWGELSSEQALCRCAWRVRGAGDLDINRRDRALALLQAAAAVWMSAAEAASVLKAFE